MGIAQILKITEAIRWMNSTQPQVLNKIAAKQFTYQGKEAGFLKYEKKYSMGVCHLTISFRNGKLNAISWNEYVGYAGELRGEVTLEGFEEAESFDIMSGFKNYERRLALTLIDHSETANEIVVTMGRMTESDLKRRSGALHGGQKVSGPRNASPNTNSKPMPKAFFHGVNESNSNLSKYLPAPSVILDYTYANLCDSLKRNNIQCKKDSSFAEGDFDGYRIETTDGSYYLTPDQKLRSYQFKVPVGKQDVVNYLVSNGAILKRCEGFNCAFEYQNCYIDVSDLDKTHSLISYSRQNH